MTGCKHKTTTVSLVFKDGTMTRKCDACGGLFGPYDVRAWNAARYRKHTEGEVK